MSYKNHGGAGSAASSGADDMAHNAGSLRVNDGGWEISGDMSFATANELLRLGTDAWDKGAPVWIDMQQVTRADSAGVAVLLAWLRRAKEENSVLQLRAIPPQLLSLAEFYGIKKIFDRG